MQYFYVQTKKKKKKEAAALFNRQQQCMNCDSEWMQGWPGFALNMRAIRDSCQPPATFGRKSETEWVQEPEHQLAHVPLSGGTFSYKCFYNTGLWMSPHSSFGSVLFWHIFIIRLKGNAKATENRTALYYCQPDRDMTGPEINFQKKFTLVHLYSGDYSHCMCPLTCRYLLR